MIDQYDPSRTEALRHQIKKDLGPLSSEEMREIAGAGEKERQHLYGAMVDRYHEMFLLTQGSEVGDPYLIQVDRDRDALHQQLKEIARGFGKTSVDVQMDLIVREGSLKDYGFPDLALLTSDTDDGWLGAFEFDHRTQKLDRKIDAETHQGYGLRGDEEDFERGVREFAIEHVPGIEGVTCVDKLIKGEIAIIFGAHVAEDLASYAISIVPKEFYERARRAVAAADSIKSKVFYSTTNQYHGAVTVVGVVLPAEKLEPDFLNVLKDDREGLSVDAKDMDAEVVRDDLVDILLYAQSHINRISREVGKDVYELYLKERRQVLGDTIPSDKVLQKRLDETSGGNLIFPVDPEDESHEDDEWDNQPKREPMSRPQSI